jgi:hypothetical protein
MQNYTQAFHFLGKIVNYDMPEIILDEEICLKNFDFCSHYGNILPGGTDNKETDVEPVGGIDTLSEPDLIQKMLHKNYSEIIENLTLRYHLMMHRKEKKAHGMILMLHGFNEKTWNKYLPWAKFLCEKTGKAVLMFPIAFHMNRAPATWSDMRAMFQICQQRKKRHSNIICSSLSNVAISTRLHNSPQRFIWSGLQTYYDIIELISNIKAGNHPSIDRDAVIDIFSYSIGSLLAEILMMTNHEDFFAQSHFASFCGGAVFNRLSPVSKFILDSEADVSLFSYLVEHIESHIKYNKILGEYLSNHHLEGINFRAMLDYRVFTAYREGIFRNIANRVYAVTLAQDKVVLSYEVANTLQGSSRDIPIKINNLDFSYPYTHENPFPILQKYENEINETFEKTFEKIADFLIR